ncbi:MAG: tail fiber protein [Planctomycetes bacterium]|nr:tail fiber protein [Planctomycetota bacterium]
MPTQINHQGVVSVNGQRFSGDGLFYFAIIDTVTGNSVWTNDATNIGTANRPNQPVVLTCVNGLYDVRLGDIVLTNMKSVPVEVFSAEKRALRIWFDDGTNGVVQLVPDHPLPSTPYAFRAAQTTNGVPAGVIVMWSGTRSNIPSGWALCDGANGTPDLRDRFVYGISASEEPGSTGGNLSHDHALAKTNRRWQVVYVAPYPNPGSPSADFILPDFNATAERDLMDASPEPGNLFLNSDPQIPALGSVWLPASTFPSAFAGGSSNRTLVKWNPLYDLTAEQVMVAPPYYKIAFIMKL